MQSSLLLSHIPFFLFKNERLLLLCAHGEPNLKEALDLIVAIDPSLKKASLLKATAETEAWLSKTKIKFISKWEEAYPKRLLRLKYPPLGLYVYGNLPEDILTLAIVGSRKPSKYGIEVLDYFLDGASNFKLQHISGLAYGIDSLAHCKTMNLNIPNFAVLGSGLKMIYPQENTTLARKIVEAQGGLLTEFPPMHQPNKYSFPWRNRIIAALSDLVWIPQATRKSGTLHTANAAEECDVQIGVTPGDVFSELSGLPNELLTHTNATCIRSKEDLRLVLSLIRKKSF